MAKKTTVPATETQLDLVDAVSKAPEGTAQDSAVEAAMANMAPKKGRKGGKPKDAAPAPAPAADAPKTDEAPDQGTDSKPEPETTLETGTALVPKDETPKALDGEILPPGDMPPQTDSKGEIKVHPMPPIPASFKIKPGTIVQADPRWIKRDDTENVRFENTDLENHINEIAQSIASGGWDNTQAITVYEKDGAYWVSHGFCRHRAALQVIESGYPLKAVTFQLENKYANEADRKASHITRNTGKRLHPLEAAMTYKWLFDFGWAEEDIAKKAGVSVTDVKNKLELASAPKDIQEAVKNEVVAATEVIRVMKEDANATNTLREALKEASATGKKVTKSKVEEVQRRRITPVNNAPKAPAPQDGTGIAMGDNRTLIVRMLTSIRKLNDALKSNNAAEIKNASGQVVYWLKVCEGRGLKPDF